MPGFAKAIGGAALGVALTLITVVGVSAIRESATDAGPGMAVLTGGDQIVSGADALALGCQPYESAILHRAAMHDQPLLTVRCVTVSTPVVPPASPAFHTVAETPLVRPFAPQPVVSVAQAQPVAQDLEPTMPRARAAQRIQSRPSGRSWQKTAMIIGGSTATGAGVGGLIGGKKGALAGAAIGGGASTIYESVKR